MIKSIVPKESRSSVREHFISDIEAWRNFAQRITKNPFVKQFLLKRDGSQCSWCRKELQNTKIIHHTTYDHSCSYNVDIRIPSPTQNHPNKTRVVPDCKGCKDENNERFMGCLSKLVLVHGKCNKTISENTYKIIKAK